MGQTKTYVHDTSFLPTDQTAGMVPSFSLPATPQYHQSLLRQLLTDKSTYKMKRRFRVIFYTASAVMSLRACVQAEAIFIYLQFLTLIKRICTGHLAVRLLAQSGQTFTCHLDTLDKKKAWTVILTSRETSTGLITVTINITIY
jgi:hypothetical protein